MDVSLLDIGTGDLVTDGLAKEQITFAIENREARAADYAENEADILDFQDPPRPDADAKDINEALAQIQKEDQARIDQAREQRQVEAPVAPTPDANEVIAQIERDDRAFHDLAREARTAQLDEVRRAELLATQEKCFAEQRADLEARLEQERQRLLKQRGRDGPCSV